MQITLLGQHPTKPLPKHQEAVSRGTLKVLGRVLLWLCSGGAVTVEVGQARGSGHRWSSMDHGKVLEAFNSCHHPA